MSTQVYIITKEGRVYSDEGLRYVGSVMKRKFNVDFFDIEFNAGKAFNRPTLLARQLEKHEDAYVVISTAEGIIFLPKSENETICFNLRENPDKTSWEILMRGCSECDDDTAQTSTEPPAIIPEVVNDDS